jgi:hypothetical protein
MYNSLIILDLQSIRRLGYGMEDRIIAVRFPGTATDIFHYPKSFLTTHLHLIPGLGKRAVIATHITGMHVVVFNLLKPTGYAMHQQFNIQQFYVLLTLYLCVLYLSQNKQRVVPLQS